MKKPITKKTTMILTLLFVVLSVSCCMGRHLLTDSPFASSHVFDGPSGVFSGPSGNVYVIDEGKKSVLLLNEKGELERSIRGGQDSDDQFFYASLVAEGADGSIYVSDARYAGQGTRISQERIFRYDDHGGNAQLLYTIDYVDSPDAPMQYGNILSLREQDGSLVFTVKTADGLDVRTYELATGKVQNKEFALPGFYISDADVDPVTRLPVFTTRLGQVCRVQKSGSVEVLGATGQTVWKLCSDGENLYYTDLASNQLLRLSLETGAQEVVIEGEDILYTAVEIDGRIYSTDYMGYYVWEDGVVTYVDSVPLAHAILRTVLWMALALSCVLALALIYILLIRPQLGKKKSATFQRMLIVLSVSLCIGGLVAYITINQMVETQNASVMEQINLFDDILIDAVDVEALKEIDEVADYQSENFEKVKAPLDALTDMTYENDTNYYYAIYTADENTIYAVMDYEETVTARHPVYAWGAEGYTEVLESGKTVEASADVSSYGSWSFVLKPILDEQGTPIAIMEVGVNLDDLMAQSRALIWEILLTVASVSVVLIMLIIETIFYIEFRERKRMHATLGVSGRFPLRTLIFLTFLADCMQDAFVSILANQLYVPFWGIPPSVGAALPLSAQVFFSALFAFLAGSFMRRMGAKKTLTTGYILQVLGFLVCGAVSNYVGLLAGKCLIGAGIGLIIVSLNSIAASSGSEEENAKAFTAVSAGTLAGVTAGAGIGSIILSFGQFSSVYFAGALILILGLLLVITGPDYKERAAKKTEEKVNFFRFLADRRTVTFLMLVLMPFLVALSLRDYFFTIYAAQMGVTETDIGRIYLLCGLVVIYAGPFLTKLLIEKLGGKWTVVVASALISIATLFYAVVPTLGAAIAGVILLSVSISFGYAAQSTYYSGLPGVKRYGESRAMGVYSLFDNGGQTLGPMIYGLAMLCGYQMGLFMVGVVLLGLLLLFIVCNGKERKSVAAKQTKELNQ